MLTSLAIIFLPALFEIAGTMLFAPKMLHVSVLDAAVFGRCFCSDAAMRNIAVSQGRGGALPARNRADRKGKNILHAGILPKSNGTGSHRCCTTCYGTCMRTNCIDCCSLVDFDHSTFWRNLRGQFVS